MRKNKNASKDAVNMIECRKKHEQMEFKFANTQKEYIELEAKFEEQKQQKVFLHTKIEKWTSRVETYSKPLKVKERIADLTRKIKDITETIAKEEVVLI